MVQKGSSKYCIGYISETDSFSITLSIKLPEKNECAKYFDSNNTYMIF